MHAGAVELFAQAVGHDFDGFILHIGFAGEDQAEQALLGDGMAGAGDLTDVPLVMIGEQGLCQRYTEALAAFGRRPDAILDNTAPVGLWDFATAAGLIPGLIPGSIPSQE